MSEKHFWIVEDGELVSYLRKGDCNKCGRCCCQNVIGIRLEAFVGRAEDGEPDYSQWEGWSYHLGQKVGWWWKLDVKDEMQESGCSAQNSDGLCGDWDSDLPAVCRYFPMHPRDIEKFPECGFSFVVLEEPEEEAEL